MTELKKAISEIKLKEKNIIEETMNCSNNQVDYFNDFNKKIESLIMKNEKHLLEIDNVHDMIVFLNKQEENAKIIIDNSFNKILNNNKEFQNKVKNELKELNDLNLNTLNVARNEQLNTSSTSKRIIKNKLENLFNDSISNIYTQIEKKIKSNIIKNTKELFGYKKINVDNLYINHIYLNTLSNVLETLAEENDKKIKLMKKNMKIDFDIESLVYNMNINKLNQELIKIKSLDPISLNQHNYLKSIEYTEKDFKRSSQALKGVRESIDYLIEELENPEQIQFDMLSMYASDAFSHLNLSIACLKNNAVEMNKILDTDTGCRDLIHNNLSDYLHSEKFRILVEEQEKATKKVKKLR